MRESEPVGELLASWRRAIDEAVSGSRRFCNAMVVASTASTMDLAADAPVGTFATCLRQTEGRGRLGRRWFEGGFGVAATAVLEMPEEDPLLATRAGMAMAAAVEPWLGSRPGLKWPNDLMVAGRKLGGVLVERSGSRASLGIGLNVLDAPRPPELAKVAVALGELVDAPPSRLEVACSLVGAIDLWMEASDSSVREAWSERDWLKGRGVRLLDGTIERRGRVLSVEPDRHLELEQEAGRKVHVPAATAQILEVIEAVRDDRSADPLGAADGSRR